jgi:3',5'-cyclic-nucleotide phosphodiesterase
MSLFGSPLFSGIVELMPRVKCALTTLEDNQDTWERKIQAEKQRRASEGRDAPLTFSSVGQDEVDQAQRNSEPTVVPMNAGDSPSSPVKRQTVRINESASAHPASDEKRKAAVGYSHQDDGYRASAPFLATPSSPLSPNSMSRRSSKDVALEKLQQLSMFANQGFNSDSRRGSADLHFNQSFPSSRRGSKDESLTTILVNSKGSPSRGSPSKPSDSSDALAGSAANRQSSHQTQKASAARNSVPSSRSHATSSATANTYQSPSTQPSSLAPTEDETQTRHQSLAIADDPFAVPGKWPTSNPDATYRAHIQDGSLSVPPIPPIPVGAQSQRRDASPAARLGSGGSDGSGSRDSPRKNERLGGAIRESRSRSRLRGLKFWKKKRDTSGDETAGGRIPRSSPSSP